MNNEKPMMISTDADLWNAADGSGFFVVKGKAKPLPEFTTPIIEDALSQGLLREATTEELELYKFDQKLEEAIRTKKIKAGKDYNQTAEIFREYEKSLNVEEEKVKEKKSVKKTVNKKTVDKPIVPPSPEKTDGDGDEDKKDNTVESKDDKKW